MCDYKQVFESFKNRFLINKRSIFSNGDIHILSPENVEYLLDNFVNNGDMGEGNFIPKIKNQLIDEPRIITENNDVINGAIEILATAVWLWRLPPSNTTQNGRKTAVKNVLDLVSPNNFLLEGDYFNRNLKGFASPGTHYNTSKPFQLAYIIKFLKKYIEVNINNFEVNFVDILKSDDLNGKVVIQVAGNIANNNPTQVSIHSALLHLFQPDYYEPILSNRHKEQIIATFEVDSDSQETNNNVDDKLKAIRDKMNIATGSFYQDELREKWDPDILPAKNVIYYGAPGTGKTYQVTELVKRKTTGNNGYFKIQQFHPSFGYEDFIDGVKPDGIDAKGNIRFSLKNGVFKELCIVAFKELYDAFQNRRTAKNFYFIADEINRAELSRVFGELLLCLEEDKRLYIDRDGKLQGQYIETQNAMLWKKEHAVVAIDKNGIVADKDKEGVEYYFGIPENLYFFGTMNDIDRSIDSFDLALRRRFKWVRKDCNYDVIEDYLLEKNAHDQTVDNYVESSKGRVRKLNKYISETLSLGGAYELGHAYFMKIRIRGGKISQAAYEQLFDYELAPLLTEYLRAEYPVGGELEKQLKVMKDIFLGKNEN